MYITSLFLDFSTQFHNITLSVSHTQQITNSRMKIKFHLPETPLQFPLTSVEQKLSSALTVTKMATTTYNHFIFPSEI